MKNPIKLCNVALSSGFVARHVSTSARRRIPGKEYHVSRNCQELISFWFRNKKIYQKSRVILLTYKAHKTPTLPSPPLPSPLYFFQAHTNQKREKIQNFTTQISTRDHHKVYITHTHINFPRKEVDGHVRSHQSTTLKTFLHFMVLRHDHPSIKASGKSQQSNTLITFLHFMVLRFEHIKVCWVRGATP